jgi:hypothetical protein
VLKELIGIKNETGFKNIFGLGSVSSRLTKDGLEGFRQTDRPNRPIVYTT